ncbi:MAG: biopolymer transporter ExbD [Thermoguttaceae bacterium]|nr:biopolymer transporter ExbD [Thermoguttaceae bacterium]
MRSPEDLKPKSFSLNLTPLIDVVFLLIIFFIVSNNIMRSEATVEVDLPEATTGKEIEKTETGKVVVNVSEKGELFLGTRPVTLDELRFELLRQKRESTVPLEIRIRTSRTAPYRVIEPILVVCAQSGLGNVSFSVLEK